MSDYLKGGNLVGGQLSLADVALWAAVFAQGGSVSEKNVQVAFSLFRGQLTWCRIGIPRSARTLPSGLPDSLSPSISIPARHEQLSQLNYYVSRSLKATYSHLISLTVLEKTTARQEGTI
jgi:hypothetical protein